MLCDLAGSEWSRDQTLHDEVMREEAKDINSSLMALKQCIHARRSNDANIDGSSAVLKPPIRDSKLTRILKECFTNMKFSTLIISTISPSSSDSEHSQDLLSLTCVRNYSTTSEQNSNPIILSSNAGQQVLISSVEGLASLNPVDDASLNSTVSELLEPKLSVEKQTASKSRSPRDWSPDEVVKWWEEAATNATLEVMNSSGSVYFFILLVFHRLYLMFRKEMMILTMILLCH